MCRLGEASRDGKQWINNQANGNKTQGRRHPIYATTQPPQQPGVGWLSSPGAWKLAPAGPPTFGPAFPGRPYCCSYDSATQFSRCANVNKDANALTHLVVASNLANQAAECLIDIDALLRGSFDEFAVEVLREVAALCTKQ